MRNLKKQSVLFGVIVLTLITCLSSVYAAEGLTKEEAVVDNESLEALVSAEATEALADMLTCAYENRMYINPLPKCAEEKARMDAAQTAFEKSEAAYKKNKNASNKSNLAQKDRIRSITNEQYIECLTDDPSFFEKLKKGTVEALKWVRDNTKIVCTQTGCTVTIGSFTEPTCKIGDPMCDPVFRPDEIVIAE